jgi:alkyl hydroperoxide reductase subunit AhpC
MAIRIGDTAPDFEADTTQGRIRFHDWIGDQWCIFFSHPADYTPVCTTELGKAAQHGDGFEKRGVKRIAISVDPLEDHKGWVNDINETQNTEVDYPIIADPNQEIAQLYDMIHPNANTKMTVRSVFVIDPDKKVKLTMTYPPSCGRNFDEILRVIDALQTAEKHQVVTPVDWRPGQACIVPPDVSDEEAKKRYGEVRADKPYLRYAQPKG